MSKKPKFLRYVADADEIVEMPLPDNRNPGTSIFPEIVFEDQPLDGKTIHASDVTEIVSFANAVIDGVGSQWQRNGKLEYRYRLNGKIDDDLQCIIEMEPGVSFIQMLNRLRDAVDKACPWCRKCETHFIDPKKFFGKIMKRADEHKFPCRKCK